MLLGGVGVGAHSALKRAMQPCEPTTHSNVTVTVPFGHLPDCHHTTPTPQNKVWVSHVATVKIRELIYQPRWKGVGGREC